MIGTAKFQYFNHRADGQARVKGSGDIFLKRLDLLGSGWIWSDFQGWEVGLGKVSDRQEVNRGIGLRPVKSGVPPDFVCGEIFWWCVDQTAGQISVRFRAGRPKRQARGLYHPWLHALIYFSQRALKHKEGKYLGVPHT